MAGSLNKVMIIGNVGRDPEMRYLPDGRPVTNFSVATNRTWNTQEGEKREETEWFRVVAFDRQAETANQYVTKGRKVYVEGRLRTRQWEGQDGQKRTSVEVYASQIVLLDRVARPDEHPVAVDQNNAGPEDVELDDVPF